jgi:hypothetical protein
MNQKQHSLPLHEWIALLAISSLLFIIFLLGRQGESEASSAGEPHYIASQHCEVTVKGAIEIPGVYVLKKGASLQDLLDVSILSCNADTARLKLNSKLRQGQSVTVPKQELVTIYIEGAVKHPCTKTLPKETRVQDLITMLDMEADADLRIFKRKRRLKDGETIHIPQKKK